MTGSSLTRVQLTEAVVRQVGLSSKDAAEMVELTIAAVTEALLQGDNVKVTSFGSFTVRPAASRRGPGRDKR